MSIYAIILLLAFLSGLSTLIGAWLATKFHKNNKAVVFGLTFAAGIMLSISLLELIPEAFNNIGIGRGAFTLVLGGLLILGANFIIPHTHLCQEERKGINHLLKTAYLCCFGLIMHDFPEGFAMANSYLHEPRLGLLISAAIALHNIPEEFAIALPVILSQKGKRFLYKMAFISGLAEPAGAVFGLIAVRALPSFTFYFMMLAAGAMIFVSLHELLPTARQYHKTKTFWHGLIASLLVYFALTIFIPEV